MSLQSIIQGLNESRKIRFLKESAFDELDSNKEYLYINEKGIHLTDELANSLFYRFLHEYNSPEDLYSYLSEANPRLVKDLAYDLSLDLKNDSEEVIGSGIKESLIDYDMQIYKDLGFSVDVDNKTIQIAFNGEQNLSLDRSSIFDYIIGDKADSNKLMKALNNGKPFFVEVDKEGVAYLNPNKIIKDEE